MSKYDFEEQPSDSDNDNDNDDDFLRHELAALSSACLPSAAVDGGFHPSSSEDEDDDDLELVRSIREQYGGGATGGGGGSDISKPLSLKPLTTLPPLAGSDDDDDDFETLRAIQRRFSQYGGNTGGGCGGGGDDGGEGEACTRERKSDGCTDDALPDDVGMPSGNEQFDVCEKDAEEGPSDTAENQAASGDTSSFPKAAQMFIEAIKKNRSCQKFVRSKLLHIEARMEEIKELQKRIKTLRDYQVQCKKKIARTLSRKQDAYIQLISSPKQRASTKGTDQNNVTAMCYGPLENSHVACFRDALTSFPLSFHREKWSKEERENLEKGIIQQFQERLFHRSADVLSALDEPGDAHGVDNVISSITNITITPEIIQDFSGKVNWEQLASMYLPRRSGAECEARWLNCENRLINGDNWTPTEDKQLLLLVEQHGLNNWKSIAEKLKNGQRSRTPFQCLARYQRSLNHSIMKRAWSEDEDAQLRAAVESFGESNWQAVASALEGRTGTQCSNRWKKTLHPARQRVGKWSADEDKRLRIAVALFGHKSWHRIAQFVPGRMQAQCRERWVNTLDPSVNRGEWTAEEDSKLIAAIEEHGYNVEHKYPWSKIAASVPMRTDNQCWRRWMRLNPQQVRLLKAARSIQKVAFISNFVDRESERPALGPNDFLPLPVAGSTNELDNDAIPRSKKKSRRGKSRRSTETAPCISKEVRSRKCRKRARSPEVEVSSDCCDEESSDGEKLLKDLKRNTSKSGSKKKKCFKEKQLEKTSSKSEESKETGEIETWDMPVTIRSRRPRGVKSKVIGVKSKVIPLISDRTADIDDTSVNTTADMSCSEENNDPEMLCERSICSYSHLKKNLESEIEATNMDDTARKQNTSVPQPEGVLTETTVQAGKCVVMELQTSSAGFTESHFVEADGRSKRKNVKKQHRHAKRLDQTEEWEDVPLTALFTEVIARIQRK